MGLVAAETNGRSQDTESLYREHGAAVAALCRSLLRDRAEAEDATQQVFLSAHRALLHGAGPREPLAWLLAVARNECYARFRDRAAVPVPSAECPDGATADASAHVMRAGELAVVWDEVGQMPPAQRDAFLLREIRGLSYGQLAEELSLSPPSVRSLLLRARTRLRRRLGDVVAGLGGASWVQALFRLVAGGDAASPVPAATKAAAVGIGALVLVGGGGPVARHATRPAGHAPARHNARARVHRAAAPVAAVGAPLEGRARPDGRSSETVRSLRGNDRSGRSESGRPSGESPAGSGRDGSDHTTAAIQQTTDGHDTERSSSSGSGSGGSGDGSSSGSTSDGGSTSGSSSESDGGSGSSVTVTTSGSSGSGTSGSSGSDGSDGG